MQGGISLRELLLLMGIVLFTELGSSLEEWRGYPGGSSHNPHTKLKRVNPSHNCQCPPQSLVCNGTDGGCRCIPQQQLCDGYDDCKFGEDERDCIHPHCPGFSCNDGKCIRLERVCDDIQDCNDGVDEAMCSGGPTIPLSCASDDKFPCADGKYCIPKDWICDGAADCKDKSDEQTCKKKCDPSESECGDGTCISWVYVCDGTPQCSDRSDEARCHETRRPRCKPGHRQCGGAGPCLEEKFWCDSKNDCGDWSDESYCANTTRCPGGYFQCRNGQCINDAWVCDGMRDCTPQGEDETNCTDNFIDEKQEDCAEDHLNCHGKCVSPDLFCDQKPDCEYGEDEYGCSTVNCPMNKFSCEESQICVDFDKKCDGQIDCMKGDDETDCLSYTCSSTSKCSDICGESDKGKEYCLCKRGFALKISDNNTCVDVDECIQFNPCSQRCENFAGGYFCSCVRGYNLRPDKETCKAEGELATIVFATDHEISTISMDGAEYYPLTDNLHNAIAVDFHFQEGLLFWTDVELKSIMMSYVNGSYPRAIVRWGLSKPTGLAVDWLNNHIYWVDTSTKRLEISDLDGSNRMPLIWSGMDNPRGMAIHPTEGYLFWTDWGKDARIERVYLDGTGRTRVISDDNSWPNGMTIDYATNIMYWVDAKDKTLNAANLDGANRKQINRYPLDHPFGVTMFEDTIYWTDWTRGIQSMNKRTGGQHYIIHDVVNFPMDIKIIHNHRQPMPIYMERTGCSLNNGRCSHLCLPGREFFTCQCPHGLILQRDGRTCSEKPNHILLFTQKKNIRMISLQNDTLLSLGSGVSPSLHRDPFKLNAKPTPSYGYNSGSQPKGGTRTNSLMDNVVPVDSVKTPVALDFDDRNDMLYWTDVVSKTISRAHLNGSAQQLLVEHGLAFPYGMAVDWLSDKIYWTDDGLNRIEVANLNGFMRSLLIWEKVDKPRDIALSPLDGLMFWTDWGDQPKIERAGMDGSNRTSLITTNVRWLNGLTLDYDNKLLYWLDAFNRKIEFSDFNGKGRETLINYISHPFGLSLYKSWLIWTDWDTSTINAANRTNGENHIIVNTAMKEKDVRDSPRDDITSSSPMDVCVFHRSRPKKITNPCKKAECSHLCLLSPTGFTCACPTGIVMEKGETICHDRPKKEILVSQLTKIRSLSLDTQYRLDTVLPFPAFKHVVAIDVDAVTNDIFVSDTGTSTIYRCAHRYCAKIITSAVGMVEGLAVDSTSRKLYWTDESRRSVEVSELNGTNRRILFTELDNPRGIVTHYPSGIFFWSDWSDSSPRIEKADMDGHNRAVFVEEDIAWPNCLTLDWDTEELYWTDAKLNTIDAIGFDGNNRRKVLKYSVPHPYGIAVLDEWVYWTDWREKSFMRALKATGEKNMTLISGITAPMAIRARPIPGDGLTNACAESNGHCSHLCLRTPGSYSCTCPTGLILKDGRVCSGEQTSYLIFAAKGYLGKMSLDTKPFWDVGLEVPNVKNPVALDVHYEKQLLFYTDTQEDAIFMVPLHNMTFPQKVVSEYLNTPDGLAVDWIANNIYWTDAGRKTIEVARLNGSSRKLIVNENLEEPRGLAVFPTKGFLFWSDWGPNSSKIEKSFLDGTERVVLVGDNLRWPNGLALDYVNERLYWVDAERNNLESCDLSGNFRRSILTDLNHPFGLTVVKSFVYWTDWNMSTIEMADKIFGTPKQVIRTDIKFPMDIISVRGDIQTGNNSCTYHNGGCTDLCMYRNSGEHVCLCGDDPDPECSTEKRNITTAGVRDKGSSGGSSISSWVIATVILILLLLVMMTIIYFIFKSRTRIMETEMVGHNRPAEGLTYSNPTYTPSNVDVAVDRRTFAWRKLHHPDNPPLCPFFCIRCCGREKSNQMKKTRDNREEDLKERVQVTKISNGRTEMVWLTKLTFKKDNNETSV